MHIPRARPLRLAALAALSGVLALVVPACSSSDGGTGPSSTTVTVTVSPTSVTLTVGGTATITATVSGSTAGVTFTSSNTSVATVSSAGVVTALSGGTTTITASVVGQANVRASTQVTVEEPAPAAFSIEIDRVTQNGQTVDLQSLAGTVEIVVVYDAPDGLEGSVDILLDDEVLTTVDVPQSGSGGSAARAAPQHELPEPGSRTAVARASSTPSEAAALGGLDLHFPASLDVEFPNGDYAMNAVLRDRERVEVATVLERLGVRLENRNGFAAWMSGEGSTPDPEDGVEWLSGAIDVGLSLAKFEDAEFDALSDLSVGFRMGGAVSNERIFFFKQQGVEERTNASGDLALVAELLLSQDPLPDGLGDFEGDLEVESIVVTPQGGAAIDVPLHLNFVLPAGSVGPLARIDNLAPQSANPLTFAAGQTELWINDSWQASATANLNGFSWIGSGASVTDGGIGSVLCDPFAVDGADFFPAATGGDFPFETLEPRLGFEYRCRDGAANERRFPLEDGSGNPQLLGVDRTSPTNERATGADLYDHREITTDVTRSFGWDTFDDLSGIDAAAWRLAYEVDRPGVTDQERCVIGRLNETTRACEPDEVEGGVVNTVDLGVLRALFFSAPGQGYNRATLEAVDRAGNRSAAVTTETLNDPDPAVVTQPPTHDGTLTGGGIESVGSAIRDDVDNFFYMHAYVMFDDEPFSHTGVLAGHPPFDGGWSLGWENDVAFNETVDPFIISVEPVVNLFNPQPNGIPVVLRDIRLTAVDVGGNETVASVNVRNDWEGQVTGFLNQGLTYHNVEGLSATGLCAPHTGDCGTNPTTLTINLRNRTQGAGSLPLFAEDVVVPYAKFPRPAGQSGLAGASRAATSTTVEDTWRSLREFVSSVTITSTDMGTFTQHDYAIVLDGDGMTVGQYELIVLGVNAGGNAVKTVTNFFQVQGVS